MKTASNSYFKVLLVIVAWLIYIIIMYTGYDHHTIFRAVARRVFFAVAGATTIIVFFLDRSYYKREKRFVEFTATITSGICVVAWLLTSWVLKQRDNTPSILFAKDPRWLPGLTIDLRQNKTFKITSSTLFSSDRTRGPYVLKDSILILDSASARKELETHRFLIRTIPHNDSIEESEHSGLKGILTRDNLPDSSDRTYLIPINDRGAISETATYFKVTFKSFN